MASVRGRGRPPKAPELLEEALRLCRDGATPQEAAGILKARGENISWRTIHSARAQNGAGGLAGLSDVEPEPTASPEPVRQALPKEMFDRICLAASRLPYDQQDTLMASMALDRLRRDAIVRALSGHPEAARDVAQELRAVDRSLPLRASKGW